MAGIQEKGFQPRESELVRSLRSIHQLFRISVVVGRISTLALIDTGSDASIISSHFLSQIPRTEFKNEVINTVKFRSACGSSIKIIGTYLLSMMIHEDDNVPVQQIFHVVDGLTEPCILGIDFITNQNVAIDSFNRRITYSNPSHNRYCINGNHLIVQRCVKKNVTVSASLTNCGYEPRYLNFTIGRDGYSLHPSQPCFWKDRIVNLNSQSYTWDNDKKQWTKVIPTHHLSTIQLTNKFPSLFDNEIEFNSFHHHAYEAGEYEQLNVLNELVTRVREETADSLSSLVLNRRAESRFWDFSQWSKTMYTFFIVTAGLFITMTISCLCIKCVKMQRDKKGLAQFAIQLQKDRLRQRARIIHYPEM